VAAFEGVQSGQVTLAAITKLQALRSALQDCQDMNAWLAGLTVTDLAAIGFSGPDAGTLKSAFADAGALWSLYTAGALPQGSSYTIPGYVFGASQRQVTGPS
jgi:hypothetical protein